MHASLVRALLVAILSGVSVLADDVPLKQLPQGAVLALQIRGLDRTQSRIIALADQIQPGLGATVREQTDQLRKQLFEGRELKGTVPDARMVMVAFEFPTSQEALSSAVLLIETENYKELRDALGGRPDEPGVKITHDDAGFDVVQRDDRTLYFQERGRFTAVVTERAAALALARKKEADGVRLPARLARAFDESDAGLYVNMRAVNQEFGEAIQNFSEQLRGLLEFAAAAQAGGDAEAAKAQAETSQRMIRGVFTFIGDLDVVAGGIQLEPSGVALALIGDVKSDSASGRFLAELSAGAHDYVNRLPRGSQMYVEMNSSPELFRALGGTGMLQQFGPSGAALEKQMKELMEAGPRNTVGAMRFGKGLAGINVSMYEKPQKALEASIQASEAMTQNASTGPVRIKDVKVERNAGKHRGITLTRVEMKFDFDAMAGQPGGELAVAQMRALMGDHLIQWMGTDQDKLYQIMEPDLDAAKAQLDQLLDNKESIAAEPSFAEALEHLPRETSLVALVDMPAMMGTVLRQMVPAGVPLAGPAGKPTFLGLALAARPAELELGLWVSTATVQQMMQMFQNFGGNPIQAAY
jgi:hypothetical protein